VRLTVRHAREAGASKQEIAEAIALAGLFGGVPAMTKAMELAIEAMREDKG
jgi:4-carboxymuconolactone decarboxylase